MKEKRLSVRGRRRNRSRRTQQRWAFSVRLTGSIDPTGSSLATLRKTHQADRFKMRLGFEVSTASAGRNRVSTALYSVSVQGGTHAALGPAFSEPDEFRAAFA
jgi:hypothetical protein